MCARIEWAALTMTDESEIRTRILIEIFCPAPKISQTLRIGDVGPDTLLMT